MVDGATRLEGGSVGVLRQRAVGIGSEMPAALARDVEDLVAAVLF